jgi:hypothetical protein
MTHNFLLLVLALVCFISSAILAFAAPVPPAAPRAWWALLLSLGCALYTLASIIH